jgi:hypothetical protein
MRFFQLIYIYYTREVPKKSPCNFLRYLTYTKIKNIYFFNWSRWSWTHGSRKKNKKRFDSSMHPVVIRFMTQRLRKLDKKQHKLNRAS